MSQTEIKYTGAIYSSRYLHFCYLFHCFFTLNSSKPTKRTLENRIFMFWPSKIKHFHVFFRQISWFSMISRNSSRQNRKFLFSRIRLLGFEGFRVKIPRNQCQKWRDLVERNSQHILKFSNSEYSKSYDLLKSGSDFGKVEKNVAFFARILDIRDF